MLVVKDNCLIRYKDCKLIYMLTCHMRFSEIILNKGL